MKQKPTVRVALIWSFVLNGGKDSILLLLTFVLAALLGPRDFGTVAMANAFLLISEMLLDLGLTAALVQRRELRDEHLDSAFWTVVGWSVVLMLVSVCLAPWWALANELPELRNVIWALAILLPIHGLVLVQNTLMQRALDFRSLAIRSNVAALTAGAVSLTAALFGWGVWALVLQRVTLGVVGSCCCGASARGALACASTTRPLASCSASRSAPCWAGSPCSRRPSPTRC